MLKEFGAVIQLIFGSPDSRIKLHRDQGIVRGI